MADVPLAQQTCVAAADAKPLTTRDAAELLSRLDGWTMTESLLTKRWTVADFAESLALANRVGAVAEAAWHHPEMRVEWGDFTVEIRTHDAEGRFAADFILAAKIDELAL